MWGYTRIYVSILFYKKWQEIDFQVAFEDGTSTSNYALASSQERGQMFIGPGKEVYEGQLVGIHQRPGDLLFNVCKKKAAPTNGRSHKEQTGKKQVQFLAVLTALQISHFPFRQYIESCNIIIFSPENGFLIGLIIR
jgi:predicted membrane GTPase involved in stress response